MRYIKILIIPLLLLVFLLATPVMAYDPPSQGTDNATDVIIWYSDNLTIESANLTGTITVSTVTVETDIDDTFTDIFFFVIVAFIISLAFIKRESIVLKAIASPVSIIFGLELALDYDAYSKEWVAGVGIGIIGMYLLFAIIMMVVEKRKENANRTGNS